MWLHSGRIQATGGFWLVLLWFWYANGFSMLTAVLSAAAVHEAGHLAVLHLLGVPVTALRLSAFGAELHAPRGRLGYGGELAAVLAGPAVNLVCGLVLAQLGPAFWAGAGAHLILGSFNLLPLRPLDGGRAVYALVCWLAGPAAGERVTRLLGALTAAGIALALAGLMWYSGGSLWLLPPLAGALLAGGKELFGT